MGRKAKDITGNKYGKWKVISRSEQKGKNAMWLCLCDCGKKSVVSGSKLRNGNSKSCGCDKSNLISEANKTHGMTNELIYKKWHCMLSRVKYDKNYKNVEVCKEWSDFNKFYNWAIKNGYSDNLTIDRINNEIGYNPDNCRWVNMKVQCNNKTNNVKIEINGETHTIAEWSRISNVKYETIRSRIRAGKKGVDLIR